MAYFSRPQSSNSAVRIVNPAEQADDAKPLPKRDSPLRQCRNILIYGSCRFQDQGCIYHHPPSTANLAREESPAPATLTAQAVNAPVFVPKTTSLTTVSTASPSQSRSFSSSPSPAPHYPSYDEYGAYAQQKSTNDPGQLLDEQDVTSQYHQVDHQVAYLSDHVSFPREPQVCNDRLSSAISVFEG
ncbi:hypothetical protein PAXRUDRAFT_241600 [Paxillus rubicundulus Ve08.2h10]|uniref:C3H1-type domain-containing protein n=1 Tax=Paxillus rubicundulus Ve08.2h10 TaxID=930991 RepID=A0A0D0DTJ1_9AGAM|nr:hypothetical protein PAXRUDRAFT_241600 [Paxillus rubicundulus Ve08.2h10]